jgi:hypothetical protein
VPQIGYIELISRLEDLDSILFRFILDSWWIFFSFTHDNHRSTITSYSSVTTG